MPSWYEKYYWYAGFKTRLYDWLTPESYFESMCQTAALVEEKKAGKVWDAGCGSGLSLVFLKRVLRKGMNYFGTDLLFVGLKKLKLRAREFEISSNVICFQNDLCSTPPFNFIIGRRALRSDAGRGQNTTKRWLALLSQRKARAARYSNRSPR